ncbi:hypothetical protein [Kitasatospora sp. NPDC017646]|uniref:hypothetical protein n=1 Tax=Kitasatospora sp. NPDC017646 TaxID=3364024 RepID=UPI00379F2304
MDDLHWDALPAGARRAVDEHLAAGRHVYAIKAVRDASPDPPPGIRDCMDVITDRMAELGLLPNAPTPPPDPAAAAAAGGSREPRAAYGLTATALKKV